MYYASIVYHHIRENRLFIASKPDDFLSFYFPLVKIREAFKMHGIELNTPDLNRGQDVLFELHIDVQRRPPAHRGYVYQYENVLVRRRNENLRRLKSYRKVFTWSTRLAQCLAGERGRLPQAVLLPYPNRLTASPVPTFWQRPLGCVLVASNKSFAVHDMRDLHPRRIAVIRAFENMAPHFFGLYGRGWEHPPALSGRIGRSWTSFRRRWLPRANRPFPSWHGPIADKDALLRQAKFSICYENGADIPGYITEKIFDCLRNGCVPIYWGPSEIGDYVPCECFIDARTFPDASDIVTHVLTMDDKRYLSHQEAMAAFLSSPQATKFSEDYFVHTLVEEIMADLRASPPPMIASSKHPA